MTYEEELDKPDHIPGEYVDSGPALDVTRVLRISVKIASTGREFSVDVPEDLTDGELIEATAWMLTTLAAHLRAEREEPVSAPRFLAAPSDKTQ